MQPTAPARGPASTSLVGIIACAVACGPGPEPASRPTPGEELWYESPARQWNSQALHLGNGHFGASFFGGVERETLALSEGSMWAGGPFDGDWEAVGVNPRAREALPRIRRAIVEGQVREADALVVSDFLGTNERFGYFTSIGDVIMTTGHDGASSYRRSLDLSRALGIVQYETDGVTHTRELFCSYPDRVLAVRLTTSEPGSLSFSIGLEVLQETFEVEAAPGRLDIVGSIDGNGRPFHVGLVVEAEGGSSSTDGATLQVSGADAASVYLTASTNHALSFPDYRGEDPKARNDRILSAAAARGYDSVKERHVRDYRGLYDRVHLDLDTDPDLVGRPTDERWRRLVAGREDAGLKLLAFNLGRYLLISASRPGSLPANLQGVWNTYREAPWRGNYQSNINIQAIYWPSGPLNLLECQEPYIDWIEDLAIAGREVAQRVYGTDGWVSHTTGNIWGHAAPVGNMRWGMYPMGAAWHAQHVWDQYAFGQDRRYLEEQAYPILRDAALFWLENLVEFEGHLISAPTVSAEHGPLPTPEGLRPAFHDLKSDQYLYNLPGVFQDVQMIGDLFSNTAEAATLLGDTAFARRLVETRERLLPPKVGRHGQLQEWAQDIDDLDGHHRHIGHLYAVCPGRQIHPTTTPDLAEAARVSLELRGDGRFPEQERVAGGNWARAHRACAWVRLMDGDRGDRILTGMLTEQGFENLTTFQHIPNDWGRPELAHEDGLYSIFQLDGSAAFPFVVAEMLLQSHMGEIHLLPALPAALGTGSVTGLRARGGYEVDVEWRDGALVRAVIRSDHGQVPRVRVGTDLVDTGSDPRVELRRGLRRLR